MRLSSAIWVGLLLAPVSAERFPVPISFRVVPERAEVWLLRDQQYEYLGQARDPLFVSMDRRDLGRRPSVFRIFYRRPWERDRQQAPARAHSVTLMLKGQDNLWPLQGSYQLGFLDQALASPRLGWSLLAGVALAGLGLQGWRVRRRQQQNSQRIYQMLEAANAIGSSLKRDDLLLFTRNAIERSVASRAGLLITAGQRLVEWGSQQYPVDEAALATVCDFLDQSRSPLVLGRGPSPFLNPFTGLEGLLAVPMLVGGKSEGAILIAREDEQGLSTAAADTLMGIGAQVGLVLVSYRNQEREKRTHRDQAVGRLAAGVAHELNTPLGAVLLAVDSAVNVMQSAPEKAGQRLKRAATGVERAHRIVDDLLLFSKGAPERIRTLDLGCQLEETTVQLKAGLDESGIQVQIDRQPDLIIEGDPQQWEHALAHLVQNAIDALREQDGPRKLVLRARRESSGERVLEIVDNGPGMSAEVLESACDPFFTTRPVGKGTGLGLSAARRVAEIHRGSLTLNSAPGQGVTVSIRVPGS